MGLPPTAELAWRWTDVGAWITKRDANEPSFAPKDVIASVSPLPLYMIQSTKDEYVPQAEWERLLAGAREPKKQVLIDASNHRFTDKRPELGAAYAAGLALDRAGGATEGSPMTDAARGASIRPIDAASAWIVAHAARLWGASLFAIVLALSWHALRGIHTHEVRAILRTLDSRPLAIAALVTDPQHRDHGPLRRDGVRRAPETRADRSDGSSARWRSAGATSSRSVRSPARRFASGSIAAASPSSRSSTPASSP